ncbi:unnamed protein product [Cuscuta campestris]|uniref:Uncharacterized protein n=1 Tax=Cuscuta campestris TaxID=132261 RepID=A0A484KRY8_9ASTE|nr:unnamed protein product [Cuscuta campestris]
MIATPSSSSREIEFTVLINLTFIIIAFIYFHGKRPIEEILRLLPGPHSDSKRSGFASNPSFDSLPGSIDYSDKIGDGRRSLVLVVFIGGVTFAEINALRFLSSQEGMPYDLIVLTTKIVNGHTLTETLMEKLG